MLQIWLVLDELEVFSCQVRVCPHLTIKEFPLHNAITFLVLKKDPVNGALESWSELVIPWFIAYPRLGPIFRSLPVKLCWETWVPQRTRECSFLASLAMELPVGPVEQGVNQDNDKISIGVRLDEFRPYKQYPALLAQGTYKWITSVDESWLFEWIHFVL